MIEALFRVMDHGGMPAMIAAIAVALVVLLRELQRGRRGSREPAAAPPPPPPAIEQPAARPSSPSLPGPASVRRGRTVLIVDDDPQMRRLLERRLLVELPSILVMTASTGLEALELVQQIPFDLLIVDVGLPGMQGPELVRRLREEGSLRPLVHVVIVSGRAPEDVGELARECGATAWVTKAEATTGRKLSELAARLLGLSLER